MANESSNGKLSNAGTAPTSVRVTTLISLVSAVSLIILGTWVLRTELSQLETRLAIVDQRLSNIERSLFSKINSAQNFETYSGEL